MTPWIEAVLSIILDRSAEQLIGAILLALAVSAAFAVLGAWLIRSRRDETARLTVVMLVLCLATMVASGAFTLMQYDPRFVSSAPDPGRGFSGRMPGDPPRIPYSRLAGLADADGDGNVSEAEYRRAAAALGVSGRPSRHVRTASVPNSMGPDGSLIIDPAGDGRRGRPRPARELHAPPVEDEGDRPASRPDDRLPESTEEHP